MQHAGDSRYSTWGCANCGAEYELNDGYGYFTTFWGENSEATCGAYSLATGAPIDDTKQPRTPEGIVRHSGSMVELKAYLDRTQVQ